MGLMRANAPVQGLMRGGTIVNGIMRAGNLVWPPPQMFAPIQLPYADLDRPSGQILGVIAPANASVSPWIDGVSRFGSSAASGPVTITTTQSNTLILAFTSGEGTSVTAPGLAFTQQAYSGPGQSNWTNVVFSATASAPLNNLTVTMSGAQQEGFTVIAIAGANLANPFPVPFVTSLDTPISITPTARNQMVIGSQESWTQDPPPIPGWQDIRSGPGSLWQRIGWITPLTNMIVSWTPGGSWSGASGGQIGMWFTVNTPITVVALGRYFNPAEVAPNVLAIRTAYSSGNLAVANLNYAGASAIDWLWSDITPVQLVPSTTYWLNFIRTAANSYILANPVTVAPQIATFGLSSPASPGPGTGANQIWGPVDFKFTL